MAIKDDKTAVNFWEAYWDNIMTVDPDYPHHGGNSRHGEIRCTTPSLYRFVVERFAVRSVLDVGAGEGHALASFHRLGVIAHGIDAMAGNVQNARFPIAQHDLTKKPYVYPCDLVHCVEVVEHIEEKYLDNLMDTLTNAPVVMMTHAVPGQAGHHHVNNQPAEYWIRAFMKRGYWPIPEMLLFRIMAKRDVNNAYFGETGFIFVKGVGQLPETLEIPDYMKNPGLPQN